MGGRILTGEVNCSDIKVTTGLEVEGRTNHATVTEGTKDLDITINRKEYNIVGDDVYIPKLYDDAPQWLKDLVDVVVEVGVEANNADLLGQVQDLINQLANATVPLNTFTQSIIALNTEDARINTVVETLNSNFSDATSNINAQIIDVRNTFVSKDEAAATIANVISAEISNGQLSNMATVGHVATALATETAARAADYNVLEASLMDEINNVEIASASAIQSLNTSVSNINGTLTSQAGQITTLTTAAAAVDGKIATASSNTINTVNTTISNGDAVVTSKWAYGSILNIGGVNYTSGFGLSNSSGTGVGSEFWIDASKLKFTNSAKTGKVAPFTIDASGTTPQVKFNGVVEFSNVSNVPSLGSTPQEVVDSINAGGTTTINGGKITTGTISAAQIAAGSITSDRISTYSLTSTNATIQNGLITNAKIADAAITTAKIGDAAITTAKIDNAQITTAKIGDLSVSTLKIQDEAVIVPRSASGIGNITLVYTPSVTHSVAIFTETDTPTYTPTYTDFKINGVIKYTYLTHNILFQTFYAGTTYTMTLTAYRTDTNSGNPLYTFNQKILMLGIKK